MEKADLPTANAFEPKEGARQPQRMQPTEEAEMPPNIEQIPPRKITFAANTACENTTSQNSSSYKEVLSQPEAGLSHRQRLVWLQRRRGTGLWAQCDNCDTWRYLPDVLDRHQLPKKWFCWLHPDVAFASCSIPESALRVRDEEDLIHSDWSAGSLVWARLAGWPWWPAMVDDCPDAEQYYWLDGFSDIPTHYNVVFFDANEPTRAWVAPDRLKPYAANRKTFRHLLKNRTYESRLKAAVAQADQAEKLPLPDRLTKYSFIARHKGTIASPKKITKRDIKKYEKQFKTKFNMDLAMEDTESDEDTEVKKVPKRKNVIILGKQKKTRRNGSEGAIDVTNNSYEQLKKIRIQDSLMPPNSMVAQAGSTLETMATESIDNDTSKTYIPETEMKKNISSVIPDIAVRVGTPDSDDFDF